MARVDRPLVVSDELGPLQGIIAEAGASDPEQRIDARTLAKGLLRAANQLSRPAPLPLVGALAAGTIAGTDLDPTVHGPGPLADSPSSPANDLTADDLGLDPPSWVNQAEGAGIAAAGLAAAGAASGLTDLDLDLDPGAAAEATAAEGDVSGVSWSPHATDDTVVGDAPSAPFDAELDGDITEIADRPTAAAAGALAGGLHADNAHFDDAHTDEVAAIGSAAAVASDGGADDGGGTGDEAGGDLDDDLDGVGTHRRRWPWVALIVLLLLGIGGAAAAVVANQDDAPAQPAIVLPVPNLVGRTETQARAIAQAGGWKIKTVEQRKNDTTKGDVLATSPPAGTRLPDGRTITLTVSAGQEIVAVPTDLSGKSVADATAALEAVGLKAETGETLYSEDVGKGVVIAPAEGTPAELERGSTVTLVVSKGPEPRVVPNGLVGAREDAATAALEALGLKAGIVRSYSDTVDEGVVISVLPASGATVERGSTVNVEVSRGPELVSVPSITSADSIAEAVAILQGAGLKAGSVSGPAAGKPQGTSPGAGTKVRPGSTVNIILG
jgi:beta-lactam-binding protein with PASTA domain